MVVASYAIGTGRCETSRSTRADCMYIGFSCDVSTYAGYIRRELTQYAYVMHLHLVNGLMIDRTMVRPVSDFVYVFIFFFSSRRRHTRCSRDWSSDVCSSD